MFRATLATWLALLIGCGMSAPQIARSENYAFLVAVGDYDAKQLKPLSYTRHDVLEFSSVLQESGFKPDNIVVMHDDLKLVKAQRYLPYAEKIRQELDLILSSVDAGDTLVVAFAGHGVQFVGDDSNYFCPLDADLEDPQRQRLISLKEIYSKLENCQADRKLLLVDACRNDPLSKLARSREKVKLNSVTRPQFEPVPKGIVALFSCSAGQESFEWPESGHGVFFQHVLSGWKGAADTGDQELSLDELVAYTRKNTQTFARLKLGAIQTPQLKGEFNGTWVLRKLEQPKEFTNSIGMKLVLIPPGDFLMGSTAADIDRLIKDFPNFQNPRGYSANEQPQHRVRISQPFYMGAFEVTRSQFEKFVAAENYVTDAERQGTGGGGYDTTSQKFDSPLQRFTWRFTGTAMEDKHPVVNVTWNDARAFTAWLSRKEGLTYRLPSEAEWEYACRANTTTRYPDGDDVAGLVRIANVADLQFKTIRGTNFATGIPFDDGHRTAARVGSKAPNAFGLYDMIGNAWEWCDDAYDEGAYARRAGVTLDPVVTADSAEYGVLRGGNWQGHPWTARSASRFAVKRDYRLDFIGFRVVALRTNLKPQ